ncbi:DUF1801 domain-containing protein [Marinihelvus fidelis]|uniref:DUF1801 domain-containing protein n=1 Tax=Marinihelvus fidelis TaxID=2613842 RepID=A0A5N0TC72_9GAMM|nr:DUF1801 domain-containing protein [Marinihelvus fidelis]KAA9132683.1 DUF1801 domain-containing protein [Marinihelvus fidelis]
MVQSKAATPEQYLEELPDERRSIMRRLHEAITANLRGGFVSVMNYGMPGYVVPHSIYPDGYHCNPKLPLPYMSLASQKQYISVYHMGLYAESGALDWFLSEYADRVGGKPDMGKCCIRFRKADQVPVALVGELAGRFTTADWIAAYERTIRR